MKHDAFSVVYLVGLVIGSVIRRIYTRGYRKAKIARRGHTVADGVLIAVVTLGMFVLPLVYVFTGWLDFANYPLGAWAGWIGAAVFAAALWLLWRSHVDLGRQWSPVVQIQAEHELITVGVYRRIRHPMYAAHWLWGIAQALLLGNWIAGPSLLVTFVPLYLLRVRNEERMMLDHFGDEYRRYVQRTGRVIPRIRRRPWQS